MCWHTRILALLLLAAHCAASGPQTPASAAPPSTEEVTDERLLFDWASDKAPHPKEMVALMDHGAKPDGYRDARGKTALMMASQIGHIVAMEALLERGADANAKTKSGGCPILAACSNGAVDAVKLLIKNGADIKATTKSGANCLVIALAANSKASSKAKVQFMEYALKQGADYMAVSRHGDTLLSGMAFKSDTVIVRALLKHAKGIDINAKNVAGKTALMYAAERGNTDILRMLLKAGANPAIDTAPQGAKPGQGKTALDLAKEGNLPKHKEVVKIFEAHALLFESDESERTEL